MGWECVATSSLQPFCKYKTIIKQIVYKKIELHFHTYNFKLRATIDHILTQEKSNLHLVITNRHWFLGPPRISWRALIQPCYFILFYFNWRLITLQYCGFCHTFTWISHRCTCVPYPDPPSHLPPNPIPQGHLSTITLSTLPHALNLDWWSISHKIIYMFQCYYLKSSHPCLLPQSPTVCSLHLCLFCCLA